MQNASYVRLKNVTLSYQIPITAVSRIGLGSASVYVAGMNLWEYTKLRKPLDPEYLRRDVLGDFSYNGAVEYPLQRIYSVGVRISF